MNIIKRDIFDEISDYLDTSEIVVVHGARQVGKTSLLYYVQSFLKEKGKMCLYIDLEDSRLTAILDSGVDEFVKYLREEGVYRGDGNEEAVYVFIDEIQYLANPSSFLKIVADHHRALKLIVSGSSSFAIKNKFKDSLVGRTVNFELFPLSFREFLTFKEYRHDRAVLKHVDITDKRREELCALYEEYVLYGGYPKIVLEPSVERKERYLQQIIDTYIRKDIKDLAHIKEVDKFNKLVEVLASQSGNMLSLTELSNTCALAKQTVAQYLFILENTYVLRLVKPYHKNLRSELFKTPKIFFYDTGLMQLLWLKQIQKEVLGNVLETAVFSDLVKYYGKDAVGYWRTTDKKEIDFILKRKTSVLPIEVKLNFAQFDATAVNYFQDKYHAETYRAVALYGKTDKSEYAYPWNLAGLS
ncbi:MAG: Uncharacterized protein Greene041614_1103 [Parcubacteria group bacterium Greene0416_14]|nr:MAG: Uncharacterized protein Greene041614_1103 [Parcubacteria group bacterium Greene0416_14]